MIYLLIFLSGVLSVSGQCGKSSDPFQLLGANDQFASCVLPFSNYAKVQLFNSTVPDTAVCTLACDEGYDTQTPLSRTIVCNGTDWVANVNTNSVCRPLTCPPLNPPANSPSSACSGMSEGDPCSMTCDTGYAPNQYATRYCRDGQWSAGEFMCTAKVCPDLPVPADSNGTLCSGKMEGEWCSWSCWGAAVAAGSNTRTCSDGMWTGTPFTCTLPNKCPQLYSPPGAYPTVCARMAPNDVCTFQAMPGFSISNASRTCQVDFTWSDEETETSPLSCPPLNAPNNAEPSSSCSESPQGTVCTHTCANGFVSNNMGTWTCYNKQWIGSNLVCSPRNCPLLTSPDNAVSDSCDNAVEGTLCSFFCLDGFRSTGHGARVCRGGEWTGYSFQCTPNTTRYAWVAGSFGSCVHNVTGESCGSPDAGVLTRPIACIDTSLPQFDTTNILDCQTQGGAHEVSTTLPCNLEPCPSYTWQLGNWAECSAECGTGYQERTALCRSSTGAIAADSLCDPLSPLRRRACNTQECSGPHYAASDWAPCSGMCYDGQGINNTRRRHVQCIDEVGNLAPVALCTITPPPSLEDCNTQNCAAFTWSSCPWETCTAQCNGGGTKAGLMAGQRQRSVFCQDAFGVGVAPSLCDAFGLPSPVTLLVGCNPAACTEVNWMTTPWSACSGTGTAGIRTRSYHCHNADGSNNISTACPNPSPTTQEACIPNSCPTSAPTALGSSRPTAAPAVSPASRLEISFFVVTFVTFIATA